MIEVTRDNGVKYMSLVANLITEINKPFGNILYFAQEKLVSNMDSSPWRSPDVPQRPQTLTRRCGRFQTLFYQIEGCTMFYVRTKRRKKSALYICYSLLGCCIPADLIFCKSYQLLKNKTFKPRSITLVYNVHWCTPLRNRMKH